MAEQDYDIGVDQEPPKLKVKDFAAKIKAKYPEYKDIDDTELTNRIIAKYPEYKSQVDFSTEPIVEKKSQVGTSDLQNGLQNGSNRIGTTDQYPSTSTSKLTSTDARIGGDEKSTPIQQPQQLNTKYSRSKTLKHIAEDNQPQVPVDDYPLTSTNRLTATDQTIMNKQAEITPPAKTLAGVYNTLVHSAARLAGGIGQLAQDKISNDIPVATIGLKDGAFREAASGFVEKLRSGASTKEEEAKMGEFDVHNKTLGQNLAALAFTAPSMVADVMAGTATGGGTFILQGVNDAAEEIENNPEAQKLSESNKMGYQYTSGLVNAALMKFNFDRILHGTGVDKYVTKNITDKVIKDFLDAGIKATKEDINAAVTKEVASLATKVQKVGLKSAVAGLSGSGTGAAMAVSHAGLHGLINLKEGKEIFDTKDIGNDILNSAANLGLFSMIAGGGGELMRSEGRPMETTEKPTPEQVIIDAVSKGETLGGAEMAIKADPTQATEALRFIAQQAHGITETGEPASGGKAPIQNKEVLDAALEKFPTPESTLAKEEPQPTITEEQIKTESNVPQEKVQDIQTDKKTQTQEQKPSTVSGSEKAGTNKPIIVYHGTSYDIEKPTLDKYGQVHEMGGMLGKAVYFTPSKSEADYFADLSLNKNKGGKKKIIEGELGIKNMTSVTDLVESASEETIQKWLSEKTGRVNNDGVTVKDIKERIKGSQSEKSLTMWLDNFGDLSRLAELNGNDAVYWGYEKGKPNEIAIVNPDLFKPQEQTPSTVTEQGKEEKIPEGELEIDESGKVVPFSQVGRTKIMFDRANKRFTYQTPTGRESSPKQSRLAASKITPRYFRTWWKEMATDEQKEQIKNIRDEMLPLLKKAQDYEYADDIETFLMRMIKDVKFHPSILKDLTDVPKSKWTAENNDNGKRFNLDTYVKDHIGLDEGLLSQEGFHGYSEPEIMDMIKDIIRKYPNGIRNKDITDRVKADNPLHELERLEDDFISLTGLDLNKALEIYEQEKDWVIDKLNIPRTIMSSMDYSAPLRQGIVAGVSHPRTALRATAEMFRASFSQKNFDRWIHDVRESPRFEDMKKSGLAVTDPHSPFLAAREEAFMNNTAEKIPLVGKLIKGSERAYVMFLNKMRVDLYNRFADRFEERGITYDNNPKMYKAIANLINSETGRGNLGVMESAAPVLNTVFFSPRLIASRVNLLTNWANPHWYKTTPKEVRVMYMKDMLKFIGLGMTTLGLIKYGVGGSDDDKNKVTVETDPRSTDFGKIKSGNTRWDIWGGFQQYIRIVAQLATGEKKSATSGELQELDAKGRFGEARSDVVNRFVRGKLAPVPSMAVDFFQGRDIVGNEVTVGKEAESHLLPLIYSDVKEAMKDKGVSSLFTVGVPAVFGVGVNTYQAKEPTPKFKVYSKTGARDVTKEEYKKYNELAIKKTNEYLEEYKKSGVYFDKYGEIVLHKKDAKTTKSFTELNEKQIKDLTGRLKTKASDEAREELKLYTKDHFKQ